MQDLPHFYKVMTAAEPEGDIDLDVSRLPTLHTAAPAEFGGPGDRWSPETLLVASVGDCFALTFRGIARASKLPWVSIECNVIGTLDRVERVMQFTAFEVRILLELPHGGSVEMAQRLLEKAEQTCLIANSLKAQVTMVAEIHVSELTAA